jgi:hypothetical protein
VPEGFSSVAGLKVIIDANADKFHSGVQGVMSVLDGMGAKGSQSLGELDKIMGLVGDAALGMRGKVNLVLNTVEAAVGLYQQFAKEGRSVAEALGATTEYDRLTSAIGDLGTTLSDTAIGGFFAVHAAGMDAASTMFGFANAADTGNESAKGFAQELLDRVAGAIDDVRLRLRLLKADMNLDTSASSLGETLGLIDRKEREIREQIRRMRAGEEESVQKIAVGRGVHEVDLVARATAELNALLERRNGLQDKYAAANAAVAEWQVSTVTGAEQMLAAEVEAIEEKNRQLGLGAVALARYTAEQKALREIDEAGIQMTPEIRKALDDRLDQIEAGTKVQVEFNEAQREKQRLEQIAAQRERSEAQIFANADREISNLRVRAESVGLNARETAELVFYETKLQQLRASGNEPDRWDLVKLQAMAVQFGINTEKVAEHNAALRRMGEIGQTVSGTLASAFAQWTRGAELDVKSMVASMLNDLAQLTFRRGVLEPLFGGGMGGSGSDGGLLGSLLGSVFGGFREGGGDVEAGKAYVVGEKRAELFIPGQSGTIAPSVGGRAGGEIHVYVHGTEDFEARVESTAEGVVARQAPAIVQAAVASSSKVGSRTLPGQLQNHQRRGTQ